MRIFLFGLTTLALSAQAAKVVSTQTVNAQAYARDLRCHDGQPGLYPLNLTIQFDTAYGVATLFYPDKQMFQNSLQVEFRGKPEETCADYKDILNTEGPQKVQLVQTIDESSVVRPDDHLCQRDLHEKLVLHWGRLTLDGESAFTIYPAPATDCKK